MIADIHMRVCQRPYDSTAACRPHLAEKHALRLTDETKLVTCRGCKRTLAYVNAKAGQSERPDFKVPDER